MLGAVRFLTILPVGPAAAPPSPAAVVMFPVVGLLVGLVWSAPVTALGGLSAPPVVTAAVVLIVDAIVTGGLHLDAVADVADGIASRRGGDDAVVIMRDAAVGALGAATLVLLCLLRYGLLVSLIDAAWWPALLLAPILGRVAMVLVMRLVPARGDSAAAVFSGSGPSVVGAAMALGAISAWPLAGVAGLVALASVLALVRLYCWWWQRLFGALNGDGVGAAGFMAETLALGALAVTAV